MPVIVASFIAAGIYVAMMEVAMRAERIRVTLIERIVFYPFSWVMFYIIVYAEAHGV